jgi:hypothetical protein
MTLAPISLDRIIRKEHAAVKTKPVHQLISDMLDTLDDLGSAPIARIDARAWYRHYARRAKRLGFPPLAKKLKR